LEGQLDDYVVSDFKADANPYAIMHTLNIKSVHVKMIVDFAKKRRSEFDEVLNTTDKELIRGVFQFHQTTIEENHWLVVTRLSLILKRLWVRLNRTVNHASARLSHQKNWWPRLKSMDKYDDLKLVSIATKDIVGALQLWVYNVKQRKLGCYHAEDAGGLSVKGTTIINYQRNQIHSKTIEKT